MRGDRLEGGALILGDPMNWKRRRTWHNLVGCVSGTLFAIVFYRGGACNGYVAVVLGIFLLVAYVCVSELNDIHELLLGRDPKEEAYEHCPRCQRRSLAWHEDQIGMWRVLRYTCRHCGREWVADRGDS